MSKLKIVRVHPTREEYGREFWCLGCNKAHVVPVSGPKAWGFNGSEERPTFTPSIKIEWTMGEHCVAHCCHSNITDGRIAYGNDCTHALKGQTVELPEWDDTRR